MSSVLWILATLVLAVVGTKSSDKSAAQQESTVTKADLELCRKQFVDAKECHTWIADNVARSNARLAEEHLTPRKVTDSDLRICQENRVDEVGCQEWTAERLAREQAHQNNKPSDKQQANEKKIPAQQIVKSSDKQQVGAKQDPAQQVDKSSDKQQADAKQNPAQQVDKSPDKKQSDAQQNSAQQVDTSSDKKQSDAKTSLASSGKTQADTKKVSAEAGEAEHVDAGKTTEASELSNDVKRKSSLSENHEDTRSKADRDEQKTPEGSKKIQPTSAPNGGGWSMPWPFMFVATNQMANSTKKAFQEEWCRRENVAEKDCEKWVADQMARKAVRKADEEARKNARHADEEARKGARRADQESREADRSSHGKHEAKNKSETSEPAILLSIEKATKQPSTLLVSLLAAGMLLGVLIAMIVSVTRPHKQQPMNSPLLEACFAEV